MPKKRVPNFAVGKITLSRKLCSPSSQYISLTVLCSSARMLCIATHLFLVSNRESCELINQNVVKITAKIVHITKNLSKCVFIKNNEAIDTGIPKNNIPNKTVGLITLLSKLYFSLYSQKSSLEVGALIFKLALTLPLYLFTHSFCEASKCFLAPIKNNVVTIAAISVQITKNFFMFLPLSQKLEVVNVY